MGVPYQLISCKPIPTKETVELNGGIASLSDFNYLYDPAYKAQLALPLTGKDKGFYDFSDATINEEFNAASAVWHKGKYFS